MSGVTLVHLLDAELPQTQCGQCGFNGCHPYAAAIAAGSTPINRCAPGGAEGIAALAALTGVRVIPLDPTYGDVKPRRVALIDEARCIGCTLCLDACPVDAIVGAPKRMHTVITDDCTGCELCLAPCPVDCIALDPLPLQPDRAGVLAAAHVARQRYTARTLRLQQRERGAASRARRAAAAVKAQAVLRALARARRRQGSMA